MTRLIDEAGHDINVGDTVVDFRGNKHMVLGWTPGSHAGSTGSVTVADKSYTLASRDRKPLRGVNT